MKKNKHNEELSNYNKYINNLKQRGYKNLPPESDLNQTLTDAIKEGDNLLELEEKSKNSLNTNSSTPTSTNPYRKAWIKIVSEMDAEKKRFIERLQKEGKLDSYQYEDFIKQVAKLGDEYSNQ